MKERLKERAIADGRFFDGTCPSIEQLSGKVVWVQGCAVGNYTSNWTWNAPNNGGILIWADGELEVGGRSDFWGIIYHLNNQNSSSDELLRLRGGLHDPRWRLRRRSGRHRRRLEPGEHRVRRARVHLGQLVRQRQHRPELLARHHRRVGCPA